MANNDQALKAAKMAIQPFKKLLPEMKRLIQDEEQSLRILATETKHLSHYNVQLKKQLDNHKLGDMELNIIHGKHTICLQAMNLNRRGLEKGKNRLSDYQTQYQDGVLTYKALLTRIQQLERAQRKNTILENDLDSESFRHSTLTSQVHTAGVDYKQQNDRMHVLSDEVAAAEALQRRLAVVAPATNGTNKTALSNSTTVRVVKQMTPQELKLRKKKRKMAVLDRLRATSALNIARERMQKARKTLMKKESTAKEGGVKMLSLAGRKQRKDRGIGQQTEQIVLQQEAEFDSDSRK